MASKVEIANIALNTIGEDPITAFTDDDKAARVINLRYESVRRAVLRAHPWNCVIARSSLAQDTATPDFGFDYQYSLPSDFLRVVRLSDPNIHYRIEGKKLLTDASTVNLIYIKNETDVTKYDALLYEAVAARLAQEIAMPITNDKEMVDMANSLYESKLAEARSIDAMEEGPFQFESDLWLDSRDAVGDFRPIEDPD